MVRRFRRASVPPSARSKVVKKPKRLFDMPFEEAPPPITKAVPPACLLRLFYIQVTCCRSYAANTYTSKRN